MMDETTPIAPALTAWEWEPTDPTGEITYTGPRSGTADDAQAWIEGGELWLPESREGEYIVANRHGLAALCLYGQPFGFTQAHVDNLRNPAFWRYREDAHLWLGLADLIAALLPPVPV